MMVKVVFGVVLFLACVATGTSRYRYERPSRVVEIKQGRLQGTMVEVPLTSPFSSNGDKNQVKKDPQKDDNPIIIFHTLLKITKNGSKASWKIDFFSKLELEYELKAILFFGDVQTVFMYSYVRYTYYDTIMLWPCFLLEYFRFLNPQNTYSTL